MFIFDRLLLAHLLADFPFQTNWIYAQKLKSIWGVILHCGIVTLLNVIFLFPYLHLPQVWGAILFLFAVHVTIDQYKIVITKREKELDNNFFFIQDQGFHLLSILLAIHWFGLDRLGVLPLPSYLTAYNNDYWIWVAIAIIIAAFTGKVFLYYIKRQFQDPELTFNATPTDNLIRAGITLFVALPGNAWLLILPMIYVNYKVQFRNPKKDTISFWFNPLFAIPAGFAIRYFFP